MTLSRRGLFAAVAATGVVGAAAAQELRVVAPGLPVQLDPHLALTPLDRAVAAELFLGLLTRDATGTLAPALAESWTESADGLSYTFTLRPDLRWANGAALTIQDIVFSFQRALAPATQAPFAPLLGGLLGATELRNGATPRAFGVRGSGRQVVLTLTERSSRFLDVLAQPIAAIVPRSEIESRAGEWTRAERVVCSGPYTPVSAPAAFSLVRNARSPLAAVADVVHVETADSFEAAAERVRRGGADVAWGFTPEIVTERALQRTLKAEPGQALLYVAVNRTRPKLDNRECRHALGMSIDRERLIRSLRLSDAPYVAAPSYSAVPPAARSTPTPRTAPYQRIDADDRLILAQVLLQEVDIDPSRPGRFRLVHAAGRTAAAIAKALADGWSKLGVRCEVHELTAAAYPEALLRGDYDLAVVASWARDTNAWPYLAMLSGAAGADNLTRYAEADFDRHLAEAAAATDPTMIVQGLGDAEGMLAEDQIILPILSFRPVAAVAPHLSGWEPNPRGVHPLRLLGAG